jgi:hypothetical protein
MGFLRRLFVGNEMFSDKDLKNVQNYEDMLPYRHIYQDAVRIINKRFYEDLLVVELGVRAGVSARILYDSLKYGTISDFKLVLIDIKRHPQTEIFDDLKEVEFIERGAESISDRFQDESIHILHIDVDPHDYMGTINFFTLYKRKIKKQGMIIFHDCSPKFGVKKAVEEINGINGWDVTFFEPHPDSPESVPAVAIKNIF